MIKDLRNFQHLTFEKGETIFKAGETGSHAYVINSGLIKVYHFEKGQKKVLGYMKPGQVLGEMAIITGEPRAANAEAVERTEILVVDDGVMKNIVSRCLPLVRSLMEQFIHRIRDTDQRIQAGEFDFSAERCHKMETTLREIMATSEKSLSDSSLDPKARTCLAKINGSCLSVLDD